LQKHKIKHKKSNTLKFYNIIFLVIYIFFVYILLFSPLLHDEVDIIINKYQFTPFYSIKKFYNYEIYMQIWGNILVTIPLPLLLYFSKPNSKFINITLLSVFTTLAIEPLQLFFDIFSQKNRFVIDIDDTILNLSGIIIGLIFVGLVKILKNK